MHIGSKQQQEVAAGLRGGDDDCARKGQSLTNCQLSVSCRQRKVTSFSHRKGREGMETSTMSPRH